MARKKTPDVSTLPPVVEPDSSAVQQPPMNGGKPRAKANRPSRSRAFGAKRRRPTRPSPPRRSTPPPRKCGWSRRTLPRPNRHWNPCAGIRTPPPFSSRRLRHQAEALNQEMDQTRRQAAQEAEGLGELRRAEPGCARSAREATGDLAELIREMGEARGQAQLRQEAGEAAHTTGELAELSREMGEARPAFGAAPGGRRSLADGRRSAHPIAGGRHGDRRGRRRGASDAGAGSRRCGRIRKGQRLLGAEGDIRDEYAASAGAGPRSPATGRHHGG